MLETAVYWTIRLLIWILVQCYLFTNWFYAELYAYGMRDDAPWRRRP